MKSEHNWLALDFETSDQNVYTCKIDRCCLSTGIVKQDISWRGIGNQSYTLDEAITTHKDIPLLAHNAKFELHILRRLGINPTQPIHDTMLMAKHWKNNLPAYDLKSLSWWLFGDLYTPLTKLREWIHKHNINGEDDIEFDMTQCPDKLVHDYCTHDVEMTLRIANKLYPLVKDNYAYQQDIETITLVQEMESRGIMADVQYYKNFIRKGARRVQYNTNVAKEQLGIANGNRKPTGNVLRDHLAGRGEGRCTATGLIKTDDTVLRDHKDSRAVRAVGRIRSDQKEIKTYAQNILAVTDSRGIFHPNLMQSAAITRRFKSAGFFGSNGITAKGNTQNFPRGKGIRSGITVPKGYTFVKMDLASIEARLASHAMSLFLDFNFYCEKYTANNKFNMYLHVLHEYTEHKNATKKDAIYTAYKHACLGIQYGVGIETFHKTLVDNFELPYSLEECNHIYATIRKKCPEFSALQRAVSSIIESQGYITDDFGAVYYVPEEEKYKGVNHYCQGCAGNILKWWWIKCAEVAKKHGQDYFFNTIHDELDGAVKNDSETQRRVREYCDTLNKLDIFNLPICAEATVGNNWGEVG